MIRGLSQVSLKGASEKARQSVQKYADYYRSAKGELPEKIAAFPGDYDALLAAVNRGIKEERDLWGGLCWKGVTLQRGVHS